MNKIIFVSGNLERGGAQRVMTLLANAYASKGWKTSIAVLLDADKGYEISPDIDLIDFSRKGNYIKNLLYWIRSLRALFKREQPDAILSFVGRINVITMVAAAGLGIPVIVSERNDPARDRRNALEVRLCKYCYSRADRVVFQTNYQKEFYGNTSKNNALIIGNPIAARPFYGSHSGKDIIAVGKLMEQKDHGTLIRAYSRIAQEYPDVNLRIFGEGVLRQSLQQLTDDLNLHDRVILEGNVDGIFSIMQENPYYVMTSQYEGLSNALLEAMVSGMVCISTRWDGVEDVIVHEKNGFLVPCGDPDSLAECLRNVLGASHDDLIAESIRTGENYLCENVIDSWFTAVESILR